MRDIVVRMDLDDGRFRSKLVINRKELAKLKPAVDSVSNSIERAERRTRSWGRRLRDTVVILGEGGDALRALHTIFLALPSSILKANSEIEKATVLMQGLSDSTKSYADFNAAAEKSVEGLYSYVGKTPFAVDAITDSFVKLKSAGLDPMTGPLQSLVDSVAKFGGTSEQLKRASIAIQQMAGKGVISMEELRQQLGEAVPNAVMIMARALDQSIGDLVDKISDGTVAAPAALKAMFHQMELENAGSALIMAQTWEGTINRMKTNWITLQKEIGEAGFFDAAKDALKSFTDGFLNSPEALQAAQSFGEALTAIVKGAESGVKTIGEYADTIGLVIKAFIAYKVAALASGKATAAWTVATGAAAAAQRAFGIVQMRHQTTYMNVYEATMKKTLATKGHYTTASIAAARATAMEAAATRSLAAAKGLAMASAGRLGSSLVSLAGGPVGAAALAVWGLYEAYQALTSQSREYKALISEDSDAGTFGASQIDLLKTELASLEDKLKSGKEYLDFYDSKGISNANTEAIKNNIAEYEKLITAGKSKLEKAEREFGNRQAATSVSDFMSGLAEDMKKGQVEFRLALEKFNDEIFKDTSLSDEEKQRRVAENRAMLVNKLVDQNIALYNQALRKERDALKRATTQSEQYPIVGRIEELESAIKRQNELRKMPGGLEILTKSGGAKDASKSPFERYIESMTAAIAKVGAKAQEANPYLAEFKANLSSGKYSDLSTKEIEQAEALAASRYSIEKAYKAEKRAKSELIKVEDKLSSLQGTIAKRYGKRSSVNEWIKPLSDVKKYRESLDRLLETQKRLRQDAINGGVGQTIVDDFDAAIDRIQKMEASLNSLAASEIMAELGEKTRKINNSLLTNDEQAAAARSEEVKRIEELMTKMEALGVLTDANREKIQNYLTSIDDEFARKTETPLDSLLRKWEDSAEQMKDVWASAMDGFAGELTDALVDGEANFKDFFKSIMKMIVKIQIQKMIAGIATGVTNSNFFSSAFGGSNVTASANGNIVGPYGAMKLKEYANGGIARSPQLSIFGEGDTPEAYVPLPDGRTIPVTMSGGGQQAPAAQVVKVNVLNQSSQEVNAEQSGDATFDGEGFVLDVVLKNANRPGPLRDTLKSVGRN